MRTWMTTRNGAIWLSTLALLTEVWRGFLDAMFVFPVDIGDDGLMQGAALVYTLLFSAWAWSLIAASKGGRRAITAAFCINLLILLAIPVSWPFFYCPAECRAGAGIFNLVNSLNLIFGILAAVALGYQLRQRQGRDRVNAADIGGSAVT